MILQGLVQYYEQLAKVGKVTGPGWCKAKVSYSIEIGDGGEVFGIVPTKTKGTRGKKEVEIPQIMDVPEMVARSSGISANFLCDNSKYFLGIDKEGCSDRIKDCFEAAREKHLRILEKVDSPAARALKKFFETWEPEHAGENPEVAGQWEELTAGGNLIFEYRGKYLHQEPEIRKAWECFYQNRGEEKKGLCLVTGKQDEIARIHSSIKGIPGAQSSGAALVSFNAPAFESRGKEQSYNAPVGNYAAYAYTTALNYLISNDNTCFQLGDTTVVFWSEDARPECQSLFMTFNEPTTDNQKILKGVFSNLEKGWEVDVKDVEESINLKQKFYVLGLSPNAARISVRFFYVDTFGKILSNLKAHYQRMEIERAPWDNLEYLGVWRMLQETVNKKSREKKPQANLGGQVFQAILSGSRYPDSLRQGVLGRIRAEQDDKDTHTYKITRGRAAIIKADLIRNHQNLGIKEDAFVGLEESCREVGYVLGREFAVLERIQSVANPDLNTTIKDRYMNAACATPNKIFPILFKLSNSHMRKIKKEGARIYFDRLLGTLQGMISAEHDLNWLNSEQQELFFLGYYHQKQEFFKIKEEE